MGRTIDNAVLMLVAVCVLLARPSAGYPVVAIPSNCSSSCSEFPLRWTLGCVACFSRGAVNVWTADSQPLLQRAPIFERGVTSLPALALLQPIPPTAAFIANFIKDAYHSFTAAPLSDMETCIRATALAVAAGDNIDASKCKTLSSLVSSVTTVLGNVATSLQCTIAKLGWLNGFLPACNASATSTNVSITKTADLAMYFPGSISSYTPKALADANAFFTDVTAAARSLWSTTAQVGWSATKIFRNVTLAKEDFTRVKALYGSKEWKSSWTDLAKAGKLVEMDLTYMEGLTPHPEVWNVAANVLLEYSKEANGKVHLTAIAVRLSNIGGGGLAKAKVAAVYTPQKSKTAFILAMHAARSALATQAVWPGHILHFHIVQSAVAYALYNTIEAGVLTGKASHPLRRLMDPYVDPSLNSAALFRVFNLTWLSPSLPITRGSPDYLFSMFDLYMKKNPLAGKSDYYGMTPQQMLLRSKLSPELFTSARGEAWDLYPNAKLSLDVDNISTTFAKTAIYALYADDAAVRKDAAVQAFAAALVDPKGSNLGRINADNQLDTRDKLAALAGWMIAVSIIHNTAQLVDFGPVLFSPAAIPFSININALPNPTKAFSLLELMAAAQDTESYSLQIIFANIFQVVPPIGPQIVPSKCPKAGSCPAPFSSTGVPDYEGSLPWPSTGGASAAAANAAVVKFRRNVTAYLAATPHTRMTNTTFKPDTMAVKLGALITI